MSGAVEETRRAPGETGAVAPPPFAGANGTPRSAPPGGPVPSARLPDPPPEMAEDLRRAWHWEQIRELRARVFERYFYMGLTAFGALSGVALAALGVHSGEPGFYAGTAVSPGIVAGGIWGLRRLGSGAGG